jgi:hypothetical protein
MYPTAESLKAKDRDMGAVAWQREMLLKIVADEQAKRSRLQVVAPYIKNGPSFFPEAVRAVARTDL